LTISFPLENFTSEAIEKLKLMVAAKESLIKKALEVNELPIEQTESELQFSWFKVDTPAEDITAYSQFITQLCETAKLKKRVTARPQEAFENEKFAMRVWLIGLNMKGAEFTHIRKLLMKNLDGNSGHRYDESERKPREERVHKDVVSVRFTPEMLNKIAELARQSNMSRNAFIESVVAEYVQSETACDSYILNKE
jgi:predicted HicB family RNase H-like nuclease